MSWVLHFMARVPFAVIPSRASSKPRVPHALSPGTPPSHRSCHDARAHQGTWLPPEADGVSWQTVKTAVAPRDTHAGRKPRQAVLPLSTISLGVRGRGPQEHTARHALLRQAPRSA